MLQLQIAVQGGTIARCFDPSCKARLSFLWEKTVVLHLLDGPASENTTEDREREKPSPWRESNQ